MGLWGEIFSISSAMALASTAPTQIRNIFQPGRGRPPPLRILEDVQPFEAATPDQFQSVRAIFRRLARKPHDDVTRQRNLSARALDNVHVLQVVFDLVAAAHRAQDGVAARLHGQVNPVTEVLVLLQRAHNVSMKIPGEGGRKLYARHPRRGDRAEQPRKGRGPAEFFQAFVGPGPVAVDVLPYELNLSVPQPEQPFNFPDDLRRGAAALAPPRIRNDTVSAEFVTTFDDGDERDVLGV